MIKTVPIKYPNKIVFRLLSLQLFNISTGINGALERVYEYNITFKKLFLEVVNRGRKLYIFILLISDNIAINENIVDINISIIEVLPITTISLFARYITIKKKTIVIT